jgi:hypothetical protein
VTLHYVLPRNLSFARRRSQARRVEQAIQGWNRVRSGSLTNLTGGVIRHTLKAKAKPIRSNHENLQL